MFHRSRPTLQIRPAAPNEAETNSGAPNEAVQATPTESEGVMTDSTESSVSQLQPTQPQKEAETMSNFTPAYPNEASAEGMGGNAAPAAPQMPGAAPFAQQRNALQPMARNPYSGYAPAPGYGAGQDTSVSTGRKLVIGEGITMSGEIEACDHLVVEGTVEATLKGASVLDISQTGMFFGAVEINEATIAGRFEGDITVNGRLTVRSTGTISGTVSYKELAVEAGATIDGKMGPLREGRVLTAEKKPQPQGGKVNVKPLTAPESANELPFAGAKNQAMAG